MSPYKSILLAYKTICKILPGAQTNPNIHQTVDQSFLITALIWDMFTYYDKNLHLTG